MGKKIELRECSAVFAKYNLNEEIQKGTKWDNRVHKNAKTEKDQSIIRLCVHFRTFTIRPQPIVAKITTLRLLFLEQAAKVRWEMFENDQKGAFFVVSFGFVCSYNY